MRDELNNKVPNNIECGVVNMDSSKGDGTHNCCYWKMVMRNISSIVLA